MDITLKEQELEWLENEISRDSLIVFKTEDTEELEETYHSYNNTLENMQKFKEEGKDWTDRDESVFVSIKKQIMEPIISRMKVLGEETWVKHFQNV